MTRRKMLAMVLLLPPTIGVAAMAEAQAQPPGPTIAEGTRGMVGGTMVGVMSIETKGTEAVLSIGGTTAGLDWGTTLPVQPNSLVPLHEGAFKISSITRRQHGNRANIAFTPATNNATPPTEAIILPEGRTLSIAAGDTVWTLQLKALAAANATIDWWDGDIPRPETASAIHSVQISPQGTLQLGPHTLRADSIALPATDHAGWITLLAG